MRMRLRGLAVLVAFATMVLSTAVSAVVYDVTADFSTDNGNPNGAWSYGWAPGDFSAFNLYTNRGTNAVGPVWYGWAGNLTPNVDINSGSPIMGIPAGWLAIHPGNGNQPSIARWTAPPGVSGFARISGRFLPGDIGIMQVAVRKNNKEVWHAVDSGDFDLSTNVAPGDTIDFAVYGGYAYGNTPLAATINVMPTVGINLRAAIDPIMQTASANFRFKVYGKVTVKDGNSFTLDDGSGEVIQVFADGYSGISTGDYASATGILNMSGPLTMTSSPAEVVKIR